MDRSTKLIFRALLGTYAVLVIGLFIDVLFLGPSQLPEAAATYLNWWHQQPQSSVERAIGWVGLAATVLSLISILGMSVFSPWARPLFIVSVLALIGSEPLMDLPILKTPIEYFFDSVTGIIAGGIIAFSYWSGLASEFSKKSP